MKNRILSIVLAVLTVLSVVPFTMLTTEASVPAWYAESVDFGDHFEGTWDGSASRVVHGYNVEKTTLDEKSVYKISVNPADFDEPNSPTGKVYDISKNSSEKHYTEVYKGLNLYRYNDSGKNYRDKDTGFNPKTEAEKTFYLVIDYKYVKTDSPTADDVGVVLDGSKMRWSFYNAANYFEGVADSADGIIADGKWHRTSFAFTPSETQGDLWLGQMAFLPLYGIGDARMRIGDVLYIKNSVIVTDNAAGAKPTDEVTVSFYASEDDYNDCADPFDTKSGTVLTSITAPAYTGDNVDDFLYWQNADYDDVTLQAGAGYLLNRSESEDFYAVFANSVQVKFDGFGGVSPITGKSGSKITLPTPTNLIASGKKLVGWSLDDTTYALGAEYTVPADAESDITFTAVLVDPVSVTFGSDDPTNYYPGDTITIPGAPASGDDHDGETFLGWNDGSKTYKPGATYTVGNTAGTFEPKYATPQTVLLTTTLDLPVSPPNTYHPIQGTIADADAYIAENGGVGTIYVYGTYNIDNTTFKSTDLTIEGYADPANGVIEFNAVTASDLHGTNLKLTFDAITLKRADNPAADEQFTGFDGIDVTFGENCKYETGTFKGGTVGIYFGHFANSGTLTFADAKHTINAPFTASQFGVLVGYVAGGRTLTQNVEYVVNGGTFNPNLLVQNGNNGGNSDTIIGNITWTLNGGTFGNVWMGNIATKLNGTLKLTVNGGVFNSGLTFGISADNRGSAQSADNVIYILNAKKITDGKYTVPEVSANNGDKQSITRGVSILNNAELVDDIGKHIASGATYRLAVKNGKADANVDSTGALKFTFTPDATFADGYDVYVGSTKATANSDGSYTLTATATGNAYDVVQFMKKGVKLYTLNYKNGENTVKSEQVVSGTSFTLGNVGIAISGGKALKGYTDSTTEYELGATYTVPTDLTDDTITLTAVFEDFDGKTYYVSEGGSDSNDGHRKEAAYAFKTIVKAIETIGTGTGEIIVTGNTQWGTAATTYIADKNKYAWEEAEVVTVNGNVTITFKDGATVARTSPDSNIKYVGTGSLKLVNIAEIYKVDLCTNLEHQHKVIPAISNFTLEGEYKIKLPKGYWSNPNFYPVAFPADKKVTLNLNGKFNILEFYDWGTTTVDGTIYINIGKDYDGQQFVIGGDSGGNTTGTTITKPIFITATDNNNGKVIQRGGNGSGSTPTITINGLQILNINSNVTVGDTANKGNYTNNGGEYIINVPTLLVEGVKVESTELGKIKITLPDGVTATVTNGGNVQNVSETGVVTLDQGTSAVEFTAAALQIPVSVDGNALESVNATKGGLFVLPAGSSDEDATAKTIGYKYGDKAYNVGDTMSVPSDINVLELTSIKADTTKLLYYVDQTNGSDSNDGRAKELPLKSFGQVSNLTSSSEGKRDLTVKVIGTYSGNGFALPAYLYSKGELILEGEAGTDATIAFGQNGCYLRSNTIFKNIAIKSTQDGNQFITTWGYNVTFGEGTDTSKSAYRIPVHAGTTDGIDKVGGMTVTVESGTYYLCLGISYVPTGETKTWTGDIVVTIKGGAATLTMGDGYGNVKGNFVIDGNFTVTHTGGMLAGIKKGYLSGITGEDHTATLVSYPATAYDIDRTAFSTYKLYNGVTVDNDGKLTEAAYDVDTKLNYNVGDTLPTDQSFVLSKGQYVGSYMDSETEFEDKSFLPVIGAQLRLTGTDHALRFITQVSLDKLEKYNQSKDTSNYGFIVIPTEVLQGAPLYNGASYTYNGKTYEAAKVPAVKKYTVTDTYLQYTVALTGIGNDKASLKREYTVIPYIIMDGVYYYGNSYSCNLYEVAKAAQGDTTTSYTDEQKAKINSIVETVDGKTTAD